MGSGRGGPPPSPAKRLLIGRVIGAAFTGSVLAYVAVAIAVLAQSGPARGVVVLPAPARAALYAGALAALALGWTVAARVPLGDRRADESAADFLARQLFLRMIVRFAVGEAPVIAGLVATLVSRDRQYVLALGGLSLLAQVANMPRRADWDARGREQGIDMHLG